MDIEGKFLALVGTPCFSIPAVLLLTGMSALHAQDEAVPGSRPGAEMVQFIGCPVYRDTDAGLKSGCWLATEPETGAVYDISHGRTKPQIGRKVLVEGMLSERPDQCGGLPLQPVRTSVLPERCMEYMIPAEGYPGNPFELPAEVIMPSDFPRELPPPPYEPRVYHVYFDFNSDFPIYQYSEVLLEKVSLYINASNPKRVSVTGYAATAEYPVSGIALSEDPRVAESRAWMVSESLRRLDVEPSLLQTSWETDPAPTAEGDRGMVEPSRRRATISIEF